MGRASGSKKRETGSPTLQRALALEIADLAQTLYPWYAWGVRVTDDGGSCIELVCTVEGVDQQHGWIFHTKAIQEVTGRRKAVEHACGEILERFGLARHRKTEIGEVVGNRNARGDLVMDTA